MKWLLLLSSFCFITPANSFFSSVYKSFLHTLNYEVCDESDIAPNFWQLRSNLKENLFGQEIVVDKLVPIVENHFKTEPKKALVICMHGWTGSGKNYVTQLLMDSIYKKKSDSDFVRMFSGRLHFPLDTKDSVDQYKINIQNWVRGNVTNCPRTSFVFDEIDKMPSGVIDAVKPFLDYHPKIDSVDYRKSIFIFISNIGAEAINSRFMELWRLGKSREDMQYKDFEPFLRDALYSTKGAFKDSSVLESSLVSLYLPFLPLGEEQVANCIRAEFMRQKVRPVTEDLINLVLDEMDFNSDRFSTSGCKRVADIVAAIKYKTHYEL